MDIEAARDDEFLLAVDDEQITLFVEVSDIPRIQPAVTNRVSGFFRPVAITRHHLWAFYSYLAALKDGQHSCAGFEIDDLDFSFRRRDTNRKNLADRKSTRLNSSHSQISYAVFCLKKKKK